MKEWIVTFHFIVVAIKTWFRPYIVIELVPFSHMIHSLCCLLIKLFANSKRLFSVWTYRTFFCPFQPHCIYIETKRNPPFLMSGQCTYPQQHMWVLTHTHTHSLMEHLHSETMLTFLSSTGTNSDVDVGWWGAVRVELFSHLLTSHFTAVLHNLFVF